MKKIPSFDEDLYPPFIGFPKKGLDFLSKIKKNNNRPWFNKHKEEYEINLKLPLQSLVASMRQPLKEIAADVEVNPRKVFRIYRDTRFSPNKQPYKTHVSAGFFMRGGTNMGDTPGLYLFIDTTEAWIGGGIYMPDHKQLKRIRHAIANKPEEFLAAVESKTFKKRFKKLQGVKLQRMPLGFPADHPMGEWLKFKQFYAGLSWDQKACMSPKFIKRVIPVFEELLPLARFINEALKG
jgi:uncharacterized protein (TIGR02453 family)